MEHFLFDLLGGAVGAAIYTALYFKFQKHTLQQWMEQQKRASADRNPGLSRYQDHKAQ